MYNYRVSKDKWWEFARTVRQFYVETHPLMELLRAISAEKTDDKMSVFKRMTDAVDTLVDAQWTADIQMFDEGDTYMLRPLENGYFFMNNADKWGSFIEKVTYDNRGDVPPEEEKNRAVAEWCDHKIEAHEYLIYNVMSRDDFMRTAIDALLEGATHA